MTTFLESFREEFSNQFTENHKKILSLIDTHDFSQVKQRVSKELGITDKKFLDEGIHNLKRYYAVAFLDPLNEHAVSKSVDPFWHTHILFTKEYTQFCVDVVNAYMHHEPLDDSDSAEVERVRNLYEYTRQIYSKMFKSTSDIWWPDSSVDSSVLICRHCPMKYSIHNALFPVRTDIECRD